MKKLIALLLILAPAIALAAPADLNGPNISIQATTGIVGIETKAAKDIKFSTNTGTRSGDWKIKGTNGYFTPIGSAIIASNTEDGSDSSLVRLCGGGDSGADRGGCISLWGNEHANTGQIELLPGGTNDVVLTAGNIVLSASGKTLSVQEGTPASACMGSVTANGATPVDVTTSCALTGAAVFLTKTSTSAVNGSCYISTAPNNTKFTITCLATDTGTYRWLIVKESA